MSRSTIGVIWAVTFVLLEAVQYVFFGNIFQRLSTFVFGFLVFGITVVGVIGWAAIAAPQQLRAAFANPRLLFMTNFAATLAWGAYLTSVQLIEPAVAYTIGAGAMPLTAYAAYLLKVPEGEPMRNRTEALGNILLLLAIAYLAFVTITGQSGFVRGDAMVGALGVIFAIADGILFTWVLIYCQRMDRVGVGPGVVFGLRFMLYVLVAGALAGVGIGDKQSLPADEIAYIVIIGLALIIPPLLALQLAVAAVSTMTIGAITALGPFAVFILQIFEGRVEYSEATLLGLFFYFFGAVLAAFGAVRATVAASD